MAAMTHEQIEQLQQQLKEKQEEIREIYDKLAEAGVMAMPDDLLDNVTGGVTGGVDDEDLVPGSHYTGKRQRH